MTSPYAFTWKYLRPFFATKGLTPEEELDADIALDTRRLLAPLHHQEYLLEQQIEKTPVVATPAVPHDIEDSIEDWEFGRTVIEYANIHGDQATKEKVDDILK